jgi:hypothetical protein
MSMVQFITGEILFDDNGTVHQLKQEAAEWKRKPFVPMNAEAGVNSVLTDGDCGQAFE